MFFLSLLFVEKKKVGVTCVSSLALKKKKHTHTNMSTFFLLPFFFFELTTHLTTLPLLHPTEVKPYLKK